jgi:uncharacterized protein (TIGR02271 family)
MAEHEESRDRFTEIGDRYNGYEVYDRDGEKIGKVDDLFVDESDTPEYLGVKMGLFGLSGSTLVPWELTSVDEESSRIEVMAEKERVKDAPSFDDDQQITPEYEDQVYSYYGLSRSSSGEGESYSGYGEYYSEEEHSGTVTTGSESAGTVGAGMSMGDTETGEFREHDRGVEGVSQPGSDLEDEDELRVQRTEEELRAGTREREAGKVNVRKRVRTDREQIRVPKKREEVHVERVPVEGEAAEGTEAEIGEDEVTVPVTEEEVITDKRAVAKEEIRVRKDVVEDEEVVEEDVRREEVDIEDSSSSEPRSS